MTLDSVPYLRRGSLVYPLISSRPDMARGPINCWACYYSWFTRTVKGLERDHVGRQLTPPRHKVLFDSLRSLNDYGLQPLPFIALQ